MDVEYHSNLSNIEDEEIDDSSTIRLYMYKPIYRESDEDSEDMDVKNSSAFDDFEFHIVQIKKL